MAQFLLADHLDGELLLAALEGKHLAREFSLADHLEGESLSVERAKEIPLE